MGYNFYDVVCVCAYVCILCSRSAPNQGHSHELYHLQVDAKKTQNKHKKKCKKNVRKWHGSNLTLTDTNLFKRLTASVIKNPPMNITRGPLATLDYERERERGWEKREKESERKREGG